MTEKHLSTTALARLLGKESKELFVLLTSGGWILKVDNHWQLTEKGRFEGGLYMNHPKYGEYIAWPESIQQHPLLKLLPEAPLGASHLGYKWHLPSRLVNVLLAELQLIKKNLRGWLLSDEGKALGGQQHWAEQSGIPFVTWPETIVDHPLVLPHLQQLLANVDAESETALDGHSVIGSLQRRIDNWLYVNRVVHARNYVLVRGHEQIEVDFYLPDARLCMDIWDDEVSASSRLRSPADTIAWGLEKQAFYKKYKIAAIELRTMNISQLDEFLARCLLQHGVAVY
jgi:hypothetical protein